MTIELAEIEDEMVVSEEMTDDDIEELYLEFLIRERAKEGVRK